MFLEVLQMPQLLRYLSKNLGLVSSFTNITYFDYMGEESVSYQPFIIIAPDFLIDFCMLHNNFILFF